MRTLLAALVLTATLSGLFIIGAITASAAAIMAGLCGLPGALVFLGWALHAANPRLSFGQPPAAHADPRPGDIRPRQSRIATNGIGRR